MNTTTSAPVRPLSPEELLMKKDGVLDLEETLNHAYAEEGKPARPASTEQNSYSVFEKKVTWKRQSFGSVEIEVQKASLSRIKNDRINSCAEILLEESRPNFVSFSVTTTANNGTRILQAMGGVVTDVTDGGIPTFEVGVQWNGANPQSREKDKDNFDLVLLDHEGAFVQLQISMVTRDRKFWLAVQEIYAGQVVRTTAKKAVGMTSVKVGDHTALIAPLFPENAYPDADYLKTFARMGPKVVEYAIERGLSVTLSNCPVAKWQPQTKDISPDMRKAGWQTAVVTFFNLVIGWGFALCEDGKPCFVHFKSIEDEKGYSVSRNGGFPALQGMKGIALRYQDSGDGKRKALSVRVL